jgi:hypothetical protein
MGRRARQGPLDSRAQHKTDVRALHALGGNTDLTAPPTGVQAYREATAPRTRSSVRSFRQRSSFRRTRSRGSGTTWPGSLGTRRPLRRRPHPSCSRRRATSRAPPRRPRRALDPTSAAGQQAAQAASGRQALAQLGLDALNSQNTGTQDLFKGQQSIAARELPEAMTAAAQRTAGAKSQRNAAVTGFLTTARQNAQNYQIARGTLNLNTEKAAADAATRRRHDRARPAPQGGERTAAKNAGSAATQGYGPGRSGMNKYGYTYDEWTGLSPAAQSKARAGKPKTAKPVDPATQHAKDFYAQYGVKPASTKQIASARSDLQRVESYVRELKSGGTDRKTVGQLLLQGGTVPTDDGTARRARSATRRRTGCGCPPRSTSRTTGSCRRRCRTVSTRPGSSCRSSGCRRNRRPCRSPRSPSRSPATR